MVTVQMTKSNRIYLDNAATSWPKPEAVYTAVERYMREQGAPAGRSTYREAADVERHVEDTRRRIAQLIGAPSPDRIVFTFNGTDSLNFAIHGTLNPGDHVVTSVVEHNSVLRPLRELELTQGVSVTRVACDQQGIIDPGSIRKALRSDTRLIALVHASNVTGAIQPVAEIGAIACERDLIFLVDAAQTLGHLPIDVNSLGVDLLAAPGHKGLLGPLGTGVLYVAPGVEERLRSVRQGGTGTQSDEDRQPNSLPDKYESGNHNVLGIVGLGAGVEFLQQRGLDDVRRHSEELTSKLINGLKGIDGIRVFGPNDANAQMGVVSITVRGYDPRELASTLDSVYSIQVRSGIHCAPLMHETLGTATSGGTLRFSIGVFTTDEEIAVTIDAIKEIAAAAVEV